MNTADMIDCTIEGREAFYLKLTNGYGEILCDFPIYVNNRMEIVAPNGQILPRVITDVRPFGVNYYKIKSRTATQKDYVKPAKPVYISMALKHEEIRDVWMYISENPGKSYREIRINTKARSNARVHAIMKFLHDSKYIVHRYRKARSYTVILPLVSGTVNKIQQKGEIT